MKQDSNKRTKVIIYSLFLFFLGVLIIYSVIYKFPSTFEETITKVEKDVTVTDVGIADAVEKVYDSVVIINTYKNDVPYSSGSGFIYKIEKEKAYIITNHHVVAGGDVYELAYTDGTTSKAKLLGSDEYADIAVLEVDKKNDFKAVEIGKSDTMRVGDTTFTVGAPLDNTYSWTVTRGILSGKDRFVEVALNGNSTSSDYIMNVLQTDAAVNSGNSGGPLCNSNGEVVGVVNAKISSSGVEGMGFAIPMEVAQEKAEEIISGNSSRYPYLGISMLNVESALSYPQFYSYIKNNPDVKRGVIVIDVENNSSASKAGLKSGDIIVEVNGKEISNIAYLRYELYKYDVGETIELTYYRNGKEQKVEFKLTSNLEMS